MKLFFRQQGSGDPIVILHGLFGSSDNWLTVTKKLAEKNQIYLIDQRNHGRSPHDERFDYQSMVEDLKEFLIEQKIESPIIIGHSMGGKVAMNFAQQNPDSIKKLVVVDIAPRFYPVHHDSILESLMTLDLRTLQSRQEADNHLGRFIEEIDVRQFLLKNLYRDDNQNFAWRINIPVIDREIEKVGDAVNFEIKFAKPTLFIRGGQSKYIQEKDFSDIKNLFPNSKIATIEKAGHWVQAQAPSEFLDLVENFI